MSVSYARVADLVVPISTAISNAILVEDIQDAIAIVIASPDTLDALTFTLRVRRWDDTTYILIQEGDIGVALADVGLPAAAKALTYDMKRIGLSAFHSFRVNVSSNVAAERTFEVTKIWEGI